MSLSLPDDSTLIETIYFYAEKQRQTYHRVERYSEILNKLVTIAHGKGYTWNEIAEVLGVTRQRAQARYGTQKVSIDV